MKKNTRKIAAGVLAAALVVQNSALAALPSFADEATSATTESTDPASPPAQTDSAQDSAQTDAQDPAQPDAQEPAQPDAQEPAQPDAQEPAQPDAQEPAQPDADADALTISGGTAIPSTLEQGEFLIVKGIVSSADSDITSVNVGVYDANGTKLSGGTAQPNSKTFDLNRLDRYVIFDKLAAGTYVYKVTASNAAHTNFTLAEITFTVSGQNPTADTLTISGGVSIPAELTAGSSVAIKGTVNSGSSEITSVSIGIYDASGNKLSGGTAAPNTKAYDLSALDDAIHFDTLTEGTYSYKVIATNSGNANYTVVNQTFTVVAATASADTLTITGGNSIPSSIVQGNAINVTGTVTSASSNITSLTVGVYDASGKLVTGTTIAPKVKSYDLRRLDNQVAFSKLTPGNYTYSVLASNAVNTNYALVNQQFTVTAPSAQADTLTISGGTNLPETINVGQAVNVIGTVTSASSNITALTVGVYDTNGKLITGKTVAPNAKSYNLKQLDNYVAFSKLTAGNYVYAVIASNAGNTNYALVSKTFAVGSQAGQTVSTDTLTISGGTEIPENLAVGKALNVTGIVTSASSNITALTAGVYDINGKFVTGRTIAPNAKSYDLKKLDAYVAFNKLAAGKYVYAVIATNAANSNYALVNKQFTVGNASVIPDTPSSTEDKLTITGGTEVPDNIKAGAAVSVTGTVASASSNITALTVGVYDANGKLVTGRTIAPNAKTYDLKNLDASVAFNTLAAGSYTYAVIATNAANTNYALVNKKFTVGDAQSSTTDTLTITNGTNMPDNIKVGQAVNVVGTVTSASSNITSLTVGVYDANGKFVTGKTINPNAKSYDLKNLDRDVAFSNLPAGSYTYAVIATNAANTNYALVNKKFTVGDAQSSTTDALTITNGTNMPDNIKVGQAVNVVGTVTSASSNITSLTVGVYDANGKFITGRTIAPNAKTYDLKNLDAYVAFNTLTAGSYTYAVIATNAANTNYALVNKKFTVGDAQSSTTDTLTITNGTNMPDNIKVGQAVNVVGTVTSASTNITSLTCGVYDANGKFVTGRTINPNAKSYDLKNLDAYVAFNRLPAGAYTYAVIATNSGNSNYALVNKKFTVGNDTTPPTSVADALTITGGTSVPDNLKVGQAVNVVGTVTSAASNITSLTCGVYDANGKFVTGKTINPNAKSYDLKNLDRDVAFSNLPAGSYTYAVIATNSGNTNYALVNKKFTVGDTQPGTPSSDDALTITGGTMVPDTIALGRPLSITGTVTSASSNITSLTCGVYDSNGKFVTGRTINPNAKSYNLKNLDAYVAFNKLPAGSYTYAVIATNSGNTNYALVNKKFSVGSGNQQDPSSASDALTIASGTVVPDSMAVGKALSITGTVASASSNITALTCGVYDANGKFITGKTINPNAKTYDLRNLDAYVEFNKLTAGTYTYAVIASNAANTNYALVNKSFTVGSGGQQQGQTSTADALTISGGTSVPDSIALGKALSIRGTVTSASSNITALTAGVYDSNGKFVTGRTIAPNAKSYDLKKLDAYIAFNTLPAGTYVYAVIASNAANTNYALVNKSFTVTANGGTVSDPLTISGSTVVPGSLTKGKGVSVRGTITSSSSNISAVTVGVYDASGAMLTGGNAQPGTKTYNVSALDNSVRFDQLGTGTYYYKVTASNAVNSSYTLVNQSFTVR